MDVRMDTKKTCFQKRLGYVLKIRKTIGGSMVNMRPIQPLDKHQKNKITMAMNKIFISTT